jgi:phenylacetate-CoA ligase
MEIFARRLRSQWLGRDELRARQLAALQALVRHSAGHVPRVASLFRERGIDPVAIRSFDDYARLVPTLDKDQLRRDMAGLMADDADRKLIIHRTGGSSGQPIEMPRDRRSVSSFWADHLLTRSWWGVRGGEPEARIWGHYIEPPNRRAWLVMHARDLVRRHVLNHVLLSAYDMTEESMARFVRGVERAKPSELYGYVSALETMARFVKARGIDLGLAGTAMVVATSEPLYPDQRRLLRDTFKRPVLNEYGCVEFGLIAFDCPAGRMHLLEESNLVEVVDEQGRLLDEGVGEVVVTSLVNYSVPLLRYRVGDVARLSSESCPCGRGARVLESIEGRLWSLLRGVDGRVVYPHLVSQIVLRHTPEVWRFQAVQDRLDHVTIKLSSPSEIRRESRSKIAEDLMRRMGVGTRVEVEMVEEITPEPSGKYISVKSLLEPIGGEW